MPFGLILIIAGLVLVFATSLVTLGWILFAIGAWIALASLLFIALVGSKMRKGFKNFDNQFDNFFK